MGLENLAHTGVRMLDGPARSEPPCQLLYGRIIIQKLMFKNVTLGCCLDSCSSAYGSVPKSYELGKEPSTSQ
jgi:hypothetical protein